MFFFLICVAKDYEVKSFIICTLLPLTFLLFEFFCIASSICWISKGPRGCFLHPYKLILWRSSCKSSSLISLFYFREPLFILLFSFTGRVWLTESAFVIKLNVAAWGSVTTEGSFGSFELIWVLFGYQRTSRGFSFSYHFYVALMYYQNNLK